MKSRNILQTKAILTLTFVFTLLILSCGGEAEDSSSDSTKAVPEVFQGAEQKVVQQLFKIWQVDGHIGSFEEAARMAGVTITDSMRADMLHKMESNLMMHDMVAAYRPYIFTLTNQEKRIAGYIRHYEQSKGEFPPLDSVVATTGYSPDEIKSRLQFLSRLEMFYDLGAPDEYNQLGFSYGSKLTNFTFDLGTHLHVMKPAGGSEFNAGCAKEALVIVAKEYRDGEVTFNTFDPFSLEPITVNFKDGEVASVDPETSVLFTGGTCGTNNMFTSRGHAENYAAHFPQFQGQRLQILPVADALAEVKQAVAGSN